MGGFFVGVVFAWQWMDGVFGSSGSKLFWELKNEVVLLDSSFIFPPPSSSSSFSIENSCDVFEYISSF